MANRNHHRADSVTHARLVQPLPALPYEQHALNTPRSPPLLPRYRDVPGRGEVAGDEEEEQHVEDDSTLLLADNAHPPDYEPMYDYLRSRQQQQEQQHEQHPMSILDAPHSPQLAQPAQCTNTPQTYPVPRHPDNTISANEDDQPFSITIDAAAAPQLPPPSYEELYVQHQQELQRLVRQFDMDGTAAERTEDVCKWLITMTILVVTIAAVLLFCNYGV